MIGSAEALAKWIHENDDIAVFTHIRPDGDAFGTALAVTLAIRALGKRVFPAFDDVMDETYRFLPGSGLFAKAEGLPFAPKAVLCVDVADVKRLGALEAAFLSAGERACLDHHATNPGFAGVNFVDETAASASELALNVIECLGVRITEDIAVNLYTGIVTDCGNFSYNNTTPETYRKAAKCVEKGVNVEKITRILYRTRSLAKTRLLGSALNSIEMHADGKIAAIRLTKAMYEKANAVRADAQSIVNYLNEIENVQVGILADEIEGGVKFSFRAGAGADVARLARVFGGGGHIAAAGASVFGKTMEEIIPEVIREAEKQIAERA